MNFRTYNRLLLGGIASIAAFLCGATLYHQPVVGDLTRLGGYTENDFGWNGDQEVFAPALASIANVAERYDVVVFGDSFSLRTSPDRQTPHGGFWTDFLADMTGLSVGVFDLDRTSLEKVLANPAYAGAPPRLVIYQSVERSIDTRFAGAAVDCEGGLPPRAGIELHARGLSPQLSKRNTFRGLDESRFNQTVDRLNKEIPRWLGRRDATPVVRVPLSRPDLFSSRRSSEILLISDDFRKRQWTKAHVDRIRCGLHGYQRQVEGNGTTRFVTLVAPDKSTAYAAYLPPGVAMPQVCPILAADRSLSLVCVDAALRQAVASGTRDVYLPNDTHWGSIGARIAARAVADHAARGR